MAETQVVTLFVGSDPDSNEAVKVLQNMPFDLRVIKCQVGQCDFETPLLISSWGVCDGLSSIIWFGRVASQENKPDEIRAPV